LLSFDPENFAIHANLATALFELKRYAEAKPEFQWLIAKKSDLAIAYYFLAIAHDNLAEYSQALTNYQKFLQIADAKQNQLEIEKVNFRLPILEKQIKSGKGKSR
jgi:tetratricopeptide (TPR) repeat protein